MIKKLSIYLSVILLVASCYKFDKPVKPENLISKEQMVNILLDLRILSSANGSNKAILVKNNIYQNAYLLNKYKIDSLQFAQSNDYYAFYVDEYKAIYTKVKDSLEVLKKEYKIIDAQEVKEKKEKDSIARLIKKDSIKSITIKDSLRLSRKKDSIKESTLKQKIEEKGILIEPVSENDSQ